MEGDLYALPSAMVELVLRESGFRATTLGTSIPISSLIRAVQATKPKLFWLGVSHIREAFARTLNRTFPQPEKHSGGSDDRA